MEGMFSQVCSIFSRHSASALVKQEPELLGQQFLARKVPGGFNAPAGTGGLGFKGVPYSAGAHPGNEGRMCVCHLVTQQVRN